MEAFYFKEIVRMSGLGALLPGEWQKWKYMNVYVSDIEQCVYREVGNTLNA